MWSLSGGPVGSDGPATEHLACNVETKIITTAISTLTHHSTLTVHHLDCILSILKQSYVHSHMTFNQSDFIFRVTCWPSTVHVATEVFKDLATEFVERKSHDSSSLTNQRIVVTSCRHACELRTVDRLPVYQTQSFPGSVYDSQLNSIPQEVIRQLQQVIRPQSAFSLVSLLDLPVIGVQNTIVGPGVSLCCKRSSALVHTKPFSVRWRALELLRFEFAFT